MYKLDTEVLRILKELIKHSTDERWFETMRPYQRELIRLADFADRRFVRIFYDGVFYTVSENSFTYERADFILKDW